MSALETQVGQIFISDKRLSKSFVSLLSEKVPETNAEIYSLIELPVAGAAAWNEYERLSKLIQTIFRKNFRSENSNSFENSIAQINDELAKLAASGQTSWVGKLNACLAVRQNSDLYVATSGKIHAFLLRERQLSDIADSPAKPNPLKTFENFALGKVIKKDFLIFSTTQLFNYISIERFKDIISSASLAAACQTIAEIIKNLADNSIAFGTFILELGATSEFSGEQIINLSPIRENTSLKKFGDVTSTGFIMAVNGSKKIISKLRSINLRDVDLNNFRPVNIRNRVSEKARQFSEMKRIKELPRAKKFFLFSSIIFGIILIVNIFVAIHVHNKNSANTKYSLMLDDVQSKLNQSAFAYSDQSKALSLLADAKTELASIPDKGFKEQKDKLSSQIIELQNNIGGLKTIDPKELTTYKEANFDRIRFNNGSLWLINSSGNSMIQYDLKNKTFGSVFSISNSTQNASTSFEQNLYYSNKDGDLFLIDQTNKASIQQAGRLASNTTGLVLYGSPAKAYALDKANNAISSVTVDAQAPATNYFKQSVNLSDAQDLAIDGSVYILTKTSVLKFTSGLQKPFSASGLSFSDNSKILASKAWNYVYVLDSGNHKVIVYDKTGKLKAQYDSSKFNDLKDFAVDDSGKNAYILNDQTVYQISVP